MKFFKSKVEKDLDTLPKGKADLTIGGEDHETIWVAKDEESGKMFLLNHAVAFYPFPSWGSEWPIGDSVDIKEARGDAPIDMNLTFHKEMYEYVSPVTDPETGEVDTSKFLELLNSKQEEDDDEN